MEAWVVVIIGEWETLSFTFNHEAQAKAFFDKNKSEEDLIYLCKIIDQAGVNPNV